MHLFDLNVVYPVPQPTPPGHLRGSLTLTPWSELKTEPSPNILSNSLCKGRNKSWPPLRKREQFLILCRAGPLLPKFSGHCVAALLPSAENPLIESPAFDH